MHFFSFVIKNSFRYSMLWAVMTSVQKKCQPHQQPRAWNQTDKRSAPALYGWRWPLHSNVLCWEKEILTWSTFDARNLGQTFKINRLWGRNLRYLWGMPKITFSTPFSLDLSIIVLSAGMSASHPSSPKRFSEDHFLCKNSSNLLEIEKTYHIIRSMIHSRGIQLKCLHL